MVHKFHEFNPTGKPLDQVISRDQLLVNVSVYWLTRHVRLLVWPMYDSSRSAWPEGSRPCRPAFTAARPVPAARRTAQHHHPLAVDNPDGHHFIAMDQPGPLAADLRAFFAKLR